MAKLLIRLKHCNKGFTYLEILLSLFLSSSILASVAILTKISFNDLYYAKKFLHKIYATSKTNNILLKIIKDLDAHSFHIYPIIHSSDIRYKDNSLSEISKRKDDLAKNKNSDAITYLKLESIDLLKTNHYFKNTFYICPFFKKKTNIDAVRTFLALTSDDFFEVSLNLTKDKNCYIAKVSNSKSILTKKAPSNIKFLAFIPISSTYTIYLAQNKTLRFVTYKNNKIVENQPLMQNISNINFSHKLNNGFYTLFCKLKIYAKDKKDMLYSLDNLLARDNLFNFIAYINENKNGC